MERDGRSRPCTNVNAREVHLWPAKQTVAFAGSAEKVSVPRGTSSTRWTGTTPGRIPLRVSPITQPGRGEIRQQSDEVRRAAGGRARSASSPESGRIQPEFVELGAGRRQLPRGSESGGGPATTPRKSASPFRTTHTTCRSRICAVAERSAQQRTGLAPRRWRSRRSGKDRRRGR